jgi:hypothetical protein
LPLAPVTFSTTTCWPSVSLSFGEISRAMMSTGPPGGNATIIWTGFVG